MLNLLGFPGYAYGIIFGGIALIVLTILIIILPFKTWCKAMISGAYISFFRLIGMQLRKNKPEMLAEAYITAKRAGIKVTIDELESHYMSGGDVLKVVNALIAAYNAKIPLSIATAKAIDLAGRDVLSAVKFSVTPRVIETPLISAVAKDGIELIIKTRVTVRINIARLIGGAGEDTIIARVGEGIVTTVGSAESHADVLQNPDIISKTVLLKGLDAATAFEILSIDIADINVGKNIGADLKAAQAEADKKIAQAKAEERRAMAIAAEQEMRAKTQEMKAEVLSAESEVPKAMAQAFKKGNIGIMDYYKMQNIVADTSMRKALGQNQDDDNKKPKPSGSNPFGFKFDE